MSNAIEQLLTVQEIDARIRGIERELTDIPLRKAQEMLRLTEHKAALAAAEGELKKRQAEVGRLDLESQSLGARISKLRQQQVELKTNKEFKAMDGEIATVRQGITGLEDRELELMGQVEAAKADVAARAADVKREEEAILADTKVLDERADELRTELAAQKTERTVSVSGVPGNWLTYYDRIATRRKDHVLVPVENGTCGGCHMQMPPSTVHSARQREHMTVCDYCGRLLYS